MASIYFVILSPSRVYIIHTASPSSSWKGNTR